MRVLSLGLISTFTLAACTAEVNSGNTATNGGTSGSAGSAVASGGATGNSGGSSANSGGTTSSGGATGGGGGATGGSGGAPLAMTLGERITKSTVAVAAGVMEGRRNWSIWDRRDLQVSPVFTAPLPNCQTLVCYTSGSEESPTTHVVRLNAQDQLDMEIVSEPGFECRGLAAGDGGQFAVLLWEDDSSEVEPPLDVIAVQRYDAAGAALGAATELVNEDNHPTEFGIGESRLEFGGGKYGAYYHVHSLSGHEGDTLKWVDAASGAEDTEWTWGCSHSMSNLLRYNPGVGSFMPACVTDCYPGTDGDFATMSIGGIYLNHQDEKVIDVDAGCNGDVAGELGSAALAPGGYKLVFNAHQAPVTLGQDSYDPDSMNQDIGFSSIAGNLAPDPVVWLTSTATVNESDSSIALYQPGGVENYLVGWSEDDGVAYKLALVDAAGTFVEAPLDVTATVQWGRRDDPFRQHFDGDVVWAWFDSAGSTTLNIGRVDSGLACQ